MWSSRAFLLSFLLLLPLISFCRVANATVPAANRFKFVNEGEFGDYIVEYDGSYRTLSVFISPFQLCFYNTTPNAYTLALRMGLRRSESLFRWVWEANRGNPVGENATLTFGADGNLVLADADGRVAWQTNTANKGVVGFKLLPSGNMVLHDAKGKFLWQSFDHPTDTLLVGQSLRAGGVSKLVSRASDQSNSDGAYSLVMEPFGLAMYYKSPAAPKPYLYYSFAGRFTFQKEALQNVTLSVSPEGDDVPYAYEIDLDISTGGSLVLARPKYNSTLSFLRLGLDGNLKVYTYYDKVDWGAWEQTFSLFSRDSSWESECQLPSRCGSFGVCEDNQCVACPSPAGFMGWTKDCAPQKLTSCKQKFNYYKLQGVDHVMTKYTAGDGPIAEPNCQKKCSSDCKCLAYFYNKDNSRCWIAYDLNTLTRVANSTHLGYIKTPLK